MDPFIDFSKSLRSFRYAAMGIVSLFRHENNAKIHFLACIFAIIAGYLLHISPIEWCIIVIQIALVWSAEAFNTAIEKLADCVSLEKHPLIKLAKDIAAAGVLILAISAVMVASIIFIPKILALV
jgi:diacylglycerol kinase